MVMLMMDHAHTDPHAKPSLLQRVYRRFDAGFEKFRGGYIIILSTLLTHRKAFGGAFLALVIYSHFSATILFASHI